MVIHLTLHLYLTEGFRGPGGQEATLQYHEGTPGAPCNPDPRMWTAGSAIQQGRHHQQFRPRFFPSWDKLE